MTIVRREGTVIVLETGVYFPMLDLDRPRRRGLVCFQTRAGFRWLAGEGRVMSQHAIRLLFREHRQMIEKLANRLYELPIARMPSC
jgi:hypothetical protein